MTRIALIFAGQPRSADLSYDFYSNNLLSHHDVDVFGCFWKTPVSANFGNWKIDQIQWIDPEPYEQGRARKLHNYSQNHSKFYPAENVIAMYQALSVCNSLPLDDYDVVIRSRTDFALNRSFDFEQLDLTKLHQPLVKEGPSNVSVNDQFGFGSSRVMRIYFDTLSCVEDFIREGGHLSGENLLNYHLVRSGFTDADVVKHEMNDPFPPKGKDVFPHSLIRDDFVQWRGVDIANPRARWLWWETPEFIRKIRKKAKSRSSKAEKQTGVY